MKQTSQSANGTSFHSDTFNASVSDLAKYWVNQSMLIIQGKIRSTSNGIWKPKQVTYSRFMTGKNTENWMSMKLLNGTLAVIQGP